jgi:hypothetical protein
MFNVILKSAINLWPFPLMDPKLPKVEECSSMRRTSDRRPRTQKLAAGLLPVVLSILKRSFLFSGQLKITQLSNLLRNLSLIKDFKHPKKLSHLNSECCKYPVLGYSFTHDSIHQHIKGSTYFFNVVTKSIHILLLSQLS